MKNRYQRLERVAKQLGRKNIKSLDVTIAVLDNAESDLMYLSESHKTMDCKVPDYRTCYPNLYGEFI